MDNSWNANEHVVDIEVYEYMKMQNKTIECDICKKEFSFEDIEFYKKRVTYKKEKLELFYFKCPGCGRAYPISIDTKETLELKEKYSEISNRIERMQQNKELYNSSVFSRANVILEKIKRKDKYLKDKYSLSFQMLATLNN